MTTNEWKSEQITSKTVRKKTRQRWHESVLCVWSTRWPENMTGPVLSTFLRRVLAVFTISGANFYDFDRACSAKLNRNQMHNEQNILEDCSANFKSSNCSKYIFCTPRDSLSSLYVTFKSVLEPIVCCGSVFQSATLAYFYASLSHSVCFSVAWQIVVFKKWRYRAIN